MLVRDQLRKAPTLFRPLSFRYPREDILIVFVSVRRFIHDSERVVFPSWALVHQLEFDCAAEWPLESVVKFTSHHVEGHSKMSAGVGFEPVGVNTQTHLVATDTSVEWQTVPLAIRSSMPPEVSKGDLPRL